MEKDIEISEQESTFFEMDLKNIKYEIYTEENDDGDIFPYGIVHVSENEKEVLKVRVNIEEIVINIVRSFGFKGEISDRDISYILGTEEVRGKERFVMEFFGPFGLLRIDDVSDMTYDTTVPNP